MQNTSSSPSPLMQRVRDRLRLLHRSKRTEEAYCYWIEKFLRFHKERAGRWRHPEEMGSAEANEFLTWLAVDQRVAASTQNQALSARLVHCASA